MNLAERLSTLAHAEERKREILAQLTQASQAETEPPPEPEPKPQDEP